MNRLCRHLICLIWTIQLTPGHCESPIRYNRDIRPILSNKCFRCHGHDKKQRRAGLRLDTLKGARTVVVPHDLQKSRLYQRITTKNARRRMPPASSDLHLSSKEIVTLRSWIQQGAKYERHWSLIPPRRPQMLKLQGKSQPRNPIDHFVIRQIQARRLQPSQEADRRTLIRRVYLDLIGLPPDPTEIRLFLSDSRPDAYERLIERLLASPHYGERMAQDWLDLARYADTTGFAADKPRTMWLYRDWVVHAFNRNMPFDQFTIEQLAGDMLPNATVAQKIATGFHRNSMQALGNNPRKEEFRVKGIVDRVATTGRTWLGLTLGCAECHDHKYDPITQEEYYQIFAIFNNIPHHGKAFQVHGPRMTIEVPGHGKVTAQIMEEMKVPRQTHIHVRGNFKNKGKRVTPNVPSSLGRLRTANRLTFAKWLVNGQHPLVARVIVNRLWQQLFGAGLVRTPEDFGIQGAWPTHPELLDWLAVELVEHDWNLKHIIRLIIHSSTYRQRSHHARQSKNDIYNRWLAHGPRSRLSAEQIRDHALSVSGLIVHRIGGPGVYPKQPKRVGEFRDGTAGRWKTSTGGDQYRRGIYTFRQRMYPYPALQIFDAPSRERCVAQRAKSNTPLQALVTLNDPTFVEAAEALGKKLQHQKGNFASRIDRAFELVLGRLPDHEERALFRAFYHKFKRQSEQIAWKMIASTLLNLDETISKP